VETKDPSVDEYLRWAKEQDDIYKLKFEQVR